MADYSIFIAHAPADMQIAEELTRLLAETGAIVVYGADTSPTPEALDDLERAALAADAYVALLSRPSIVSPRIRAVTRKYHEQRVADPLRILLPVVLEPFPPDQLWPFLLEYPRIEAIPRTINEVDERMAIAPEILALGLMRGLHLPIPARLRRLTGIPVADPERLRRPSRPISAPITGSLVPQLQTPPPRPRSPPRALAIGGVITGLLALLVATFAFFDGATPFHIAGSTSPTATVRTLILAPGTNTPASSGTTTAAPTLTSVAPTHAATPRRTATAFPTATPIPPGTGLTGRYYLGMALQEPVALTRVDSTINCDWSNISPALSLPSANYSVRWTGRLRATTTDIYTITFVSDDGARVYFNGVANPPSIDDWNDHAPIADSFSVDLTAGQFYAMTIEYYQNGGGAIAHLLWTVGAGGSTDTVPAEQLYAQ